MRYLVLCLNVVSGDGTLQSIRVTHDRIGELLRPFLDESSLSPDKIAQVSDYLDLLLKWNAKVNLTAVREAAGIVQRHFGESFFAARHLLSQQGSSAIDLGSGAGFPGLPMKIWFPDLEVTLIESNQKKVAFLREAIRTMGMEKVEVVAKRGEEIGLRADLVTIRAVERFESALAIAGRMVAAEGQIGLMIGLAQTGIAIKMLPGFEWVKPIPFPMSDRRVIFTGRKRL